MVSGDPNVFIDLGKLDLAKYATRPPLAKALFQARIHMAQERIEFTRECVKGICWRD